MPFNGSGSFSLPGASFPAVSGAVIDSAKHNANLNDLASGLSTCITKDGQTTLTADLPMGGYKVTGAANGVADTDLATVGQISAATSLLLTGVSGTNTITATATPAPVAYAAGRVYSFVAAGNNTAATTLNINGLGAKSITVKGATALASGDIVSGMMCFVEYDGTRFQLLNPSALLLSGGTVAGNLVVSGSSTLASVSTSAATITGGSVTGITDLAIADGGTGASTAANAFANLKQAASETATGVIEIATAAEVGTGSDAVRAVTPVNMHMHYSSSKAWSCFDGTTGADQSSQGITSISRAGTGIYDITFNFTFLNTNYVMVGNAEDADSSGMTVVTRFAGDTKTTTACRIRTFSNAGTAIDASKVYVVFFGYR